jgi:hypothetical protein
MSSDTRGDAAYLAELLRSLDDEAEEDTREAMGEHILDMVNGAAEAKEEHQRALLDTIGRAQPEQERGQE